MDQGFSRSNYERNRHYNVRDNRIPRVPHKLLDAVGKQPDTQTVIIDGIKREVRTYGHQGIILMNWDDPRSLTFAHGSCKIVFDNYEYFINTSVGDDYTPFTIDREKHRIKLGFPTQEIFIDGRGYRYSYENGPLSVKLAGRRRSIGLEGKRPNVTIGDEKNTTFLAGKIHMIINAEKVVPLFLDATPQRFNIGHYNLVIKFVDSFTAVQINGIKFPVEFNELPISIWLDKREHFLSFSSLPEGIVPGQIDIVGMTDKIIIPNFLRIEKDQERQYDQRNSSEFGNGYPRRLSPHAVPHFQPPPPPIHDMPSSVMGSTGIPPVTTAPLDIPPPGMNQNSSPPHSLLPPMNPNSSPPHSLLPPMNPNASPPHSLLPLMNQPPPQIPTCQPGMPLGHMPVIPITAATLSQPPPSIALSQPLVPMSQPPPPLTMPPTVTSSESTISANPNPISTMDINSLMESLVRTGIIGNSGKQKPTSESKSKDQDERESDKLIPEAKMFDSKNLKKRRSYLIEDLYSGMQCSACGLRFLSDQTAQYSNHLDWHFRQNKRQQDSTRKPNARKLYFTADDWQIFEEIEDIDERVPSMFETEGALLTNKEAETDEEPSVAVPPGDDKEAGICPACHDSFTQFFHQDKEEWHFRNAIQVDGMNYHPSCYQDKLKVSVNILIIIINEILFI